MVSNSKQAVDCGVCVLRGAGVYSALSNHAPAWYRRLREYA